MDFTEGFVIHTHTKFMEIPMTRTLFEVFLSVQSPTEAMSKWLRNLAAFLCAELSGHSQRFVIYNSYCS
jgi:hypothetical protein